MTEVAKTGGKSFTGADGVRLKVESVKLAGTNVVNVQFSVSALEGDTLDPKNLGLRLIDAKGGEQFPIGVTINPSTRFVTVRAGRGESGLVERFAAGRFSRPDSVGRPGTRRAELEPARMERQRPVCYEDADQHDAQTHLIPLRALADRTAV